MEQVSKEVKLFLWHKNLKWYIFQFQNKNINETKTTATVKNDLKHAKVSEGNTCIAKPNLEVIPLT